MPKITQELLLEKLTPLFKEKGKRYKKEKSVVARLARTTELIVKQNNKGVKTKNKARVGDYIVSNGTDGDESYMLSSKQFKAKYVFGHHVENGFSVYQPKRQIIALKINKKVLELLDIEKKKIKLIGPLGEKMKARKGDYLACTLDYSEMYSILKQNFLETYQKAQ